MYFAIPQIRPRHSLFIGLPPHTDPSASYSTTNDESCAPPKLDHFSSEVALKACYCYRYLVFFLLTIPKRRFGSVFANSSNLKTKPSSLHQMIIEVVMHRMVKSICEMLSFFWRMEWDIPYLLRT